MRLPGGAQGVQSPVGLGRHGLFPSKSSRGQGTGSQNFSAWSRTTLGHLGQVITLFPTCRGGER